jgi:hypothetical protein
LIIPVLVLALSAPAAAGEPVKSGTPVGQRPGPYSFNVATGPQRGQQYCYICETGEKPGIIVFARELSEPLAGLLTALDAEVSPDPAEEGIRGWVTLLGDGFGLDQVADWAKEKGLRKLALGVFDDPLGPPTYLLSEEADVTVLLFVDEKVVANFAFAKGELDRAKVEEILASVPKLRQE